MTVEQAKELGYEVKLASPFEVGLIKNGKGIRTWWAIEFGAPPRPPAMRELPPLDHPKILQAIEINEREWYPR